MAQNETARTTVYLDGKQAEAALGALADKAKGLQKDLREALDAGDNVKFNKLRAELGRVESAQRSVTKESFDVERVLLNINKVSWKDLEKAQKALRSQFKSMIQETEEYIKKAEELRRVTAALDSVRASTHATTGFMGRLTQSIGGMSGPVGNAINGMIDMGKTMWALVANPIGLTITAIVGGLTLLYKAFTSTDSGAVAMEGALKAVGNVMDILLDRAMNVYKMIGAFVRLDFKGMKENAQAAFGGLGAAVKDAATAGNNYVAIMDDINDREVAAANRMNKLRNEIELLKNKAIVATGKERLAMLKQAMDKEIELNGIETGFLAERNAAETTNLASKIQNDKLSMVQKEELLKKWLAIDDTQLASAMANDAAFSEFANKNEEEFQKLQTTKSEQLGKQAELQTGTRRLQSKLASAEKEELTAGTKAYEEATKKKLELTDASNKNEVAAINKRHLEGKILEDQYEAELLAQDFKYLQEKRDIYKVGSKEYEDASAAFLERQVKAQERVKTLLQSAEKELADAKIENLKEGFDKEKALEEQRWAEELKFLKEKLIVKASLSKEEIAINDAINKTIVEKTAAHTKTTNDIASAGDLQKKIDKAQIALAQADSDKERWAAEREQAQAQYEIEIKAADGNAVAIAQAERKLADTLISIKMDELDKRQSIGDAIFSAANNAFGALAEIAGKETALGKALFLMQQAAAIGQIIFSTAIANAKAVAASPLTFGQPWVTINTVSAGISIASVIAQAITGNKGKQSGGYADSDSSDSTPVGVYHANEFIASGPAVRNPTIKPVLDIIDIAQRSGTIRSLNLPAMLGQSGRQSGGYASPASQSSPMAMISSDPEMKAINKSLAEELRLLRINGIKASVNKFGHGGIDESISDINKFNGLTK